MVKMKNKSSMAAVRNTAQVIDGFQEAYLASVSSVIDLVNSRFERMSIKGVPVKTFKAAPPEDIENSLNVVRQVTKCDGITSKSKTGHTSLQGSSEFHAASYQEHQLRLPDQEVRRSSY